MRKKKRKPVIIGLTSVIAAAGIITPLAVIYPKPEKTSPADLIIVDLTGEPGLTLPWGEDPAGLNPPRLPEKDYSPDDYQVGELHDIGPGVNEEPGNDGNKTTITYDHKPIKSGPVIRGIYGLKVVKKTPNKRFGNNAEGKQNLSDTVTYSASLPTTIKGETAAAWAKRNGYDAYRLKNILPSYFHSDGTTPLSDTDYGRLNAKQSFVAVYHFALDTTHYRTVMDISDPADPTKTVEVPVPLTGTLNVNYTIHPLVLPEVNIEPESRTIDYKANFTLPTLPADAARPHFVQKEGNPVLSVVSRPSAATPSAGQTFQVSDVSDLEEDTVFSITYAFKKESDNYTANDYAYVYKYTVTAVGVDPPDRSVLDPVEREFGQFDANAPSAPGFKGYGGRLVSAKVTAKSAAAEVANTRFSPERDRDVVWSEVNKYNPGTEFVATFDYAALPNYSGTPFTLTRNYKVLKTKVDVPKDQDNAVVNEKDYGAGKDASTIVAPTPATGFIVGEPFYYSGTQPTGTPLSPADVARRDPGDVFTVVWIMQLDKQYFSPKEGQTGDSYRVINRYNPVPRAAAYTGRLAYPDASVEYKQAAPTGFVTNALPDENKNVGYVYERIRYVVTAAPTDSSPAKDTILADLANVSTYAAGTEITAEFHFKARTGYAGKPVVITKKLKIIPAQGAEARPASGTFANVNIPYGNNGSEYVQPARAPREFIGYNPGFLKSAIFTKKAKTGTPASTSVPVVWADVDTYGAGTVITVTWSYEADHNYANTKDFEVSQTYTITFLSAISAPSQEDDTTYEYGTEAPHMPTSANVPSKGTGYRGSLQSIKVTKQSPVPGDVAIAPVPGTDVADWAATKFFNALTEFTVTWHYVPQDNYQGESFDVTRKYTVAKKVLTSAPPATLAKQTFAFSKSPLTTAPATPSYFGYTGSAAVSTVKIATPSSPAAGRQAVWSDVNSYGAGTVITVTYKFSIPSVSNYQSGPNAPETVTTAQDYEIAKLRIGMPADITNPVQDLVYKKGDDPSVFGAPPPVNGHFDFPTKEYFDQADGKGSVITAAEVMKKARNDVFSIKWTYKFKHHPNYALEDGETRTAYTIVNTYKVYETATYPKGAFSDYHGSYLHTYGDPTPTDFLPDELPVAGADNHGYVRDDSQTTYEVTYAAHDGSTKAGTFLPNLDKVSTYGAGTTIKATFVFIAKPGYKGKSEVTFKHFTIIRKKMAAIPAEEAVLPEVEVKAGNFAVPTVGNSAFVNHFTGYYLKMRGNMIYKFIPPGDNGIPKNRQAFEFVTESDEQFFNKFLPGMVIEVIWIFKTTANYEYPDTFISIRQLFKVVA